MNIKGIKAGDRIKWQNGGVMTVAKVRTGGELISDEIHFNDDGSKINKTQITPIAYEILFESVNVSFVYNISDGKLDKTPSATVKDNPLDIVEILINWDNVKNGDRMNFDDQPFTPYLYIGASPTSDDLCYLIDDNGTASLYYKNKITPYIEE